MKYKVLVLLLSFNMLLSHAQEALQVSSAEIGFVFSNNDVSGTIAGFSSSSRINTTDMTKSIIKGSVDVNTLDTDNSLRNWSLKREKYFNAETYPKITFESSSIQVDGNNIAVLGQLTIKGITKKLTFKFSKKENQLIGTTTLYSSDYGIEIKSDREKNQVDVKIVLNLK